MTVKLIRMWSGEDVIADIVKETADVLVITDPMSCSQISKGKLQSPLVAVAMSSIHCRSKEIIEQIAFAILGLL